MTVLLIIFFFSPSSTVYTSHKHSFLLLSLIPVVLFCFDAAGWLPYFSAYPVTHTHTPCHTAYFPYTFSLHLQNTAFAELFSLLSFLHFHLHPCNRHNHLTDHLTFFFLLFFLLTKPYPTTLCSLFSFPSLHLLFVLCTIIISSHSQRAFIAYKHNILHRFTTRLSIW